MKKQDLLSSPTGSLGDEKVFSLTTDSQLLWWIGW